MKNQLVFVHLLIGLFSSLSGQTPNQFKLSGTVWTHGGTMPSVEVIVRSEPEERVILTDDDGRFELDVEAGSYDLSFRMAGFYEVVVKRVEVREQSIRGLTVFLQSELPPTDVDLVVGPDPVPAPSFEVEYTPDRPMSGNRIMTGTVTLRNTGTRRLLVPRDAMDSAQADDDDLVKMNLVLESKEYESSYNGWFACRPAVDCISLGPSQTLSIQVTLWRRGEGSDPQVYGDPKGHSIEVGLSFIPAGQPDARTESITAKYWFEP